MKRKVKFDPPTIIEVDGGWKNVRYGWLFIKGLTKVGWSDFKIIAGVIVGKTPFKKELLHPNQQIMSMLKESFIEAMNKPQRTGIKGHRGYFKIKKWEQFSF
jgi:hypothetical protein